MPRRFTTLGHMWRQGARSIAHQILGLQAGIATKHTLSRFGEGFLMRVAAERCALA